MLHCNNSILKQCIIHESHYDTTLIRYKWTFFTYLNFVIIYMLYDFSLAPCLKYSRPVYLTAKISDVDCVQDYLTRVPYHVDVGCYLTIQTKLLYLLSGGSVLLASFLSSFAGTSGRFPSGGPELSCLLHSL